MPRISSSMDELRASVLHLPHHQRAHRLCHLLRRHVRTSVHHQRGRGGAIADALARPRRSPMPPPDFCLAPGRMPVFSPYHCPVHGWTAVVRVENARPTALMTDAGPPLRHSNLLADCADHRSSPHSSQALAPPGLNGRGIIATRCGLLPLLLGSTSGAAVLPGFDESDLPSPPPPAKTPQDRPFVRIISTWRAVPHGDSRRPLPNGTGGLGGASSLSSDEAAV